MIRWSLVTLVVLFSAPHAFAQDSGADSNSIIYLDPSQANDAPEDLGDEVTPERPAQRKQRPVIYADTRKSERQKSVSAGAIIAQGTGAGTLLGAAGAFAGIVFFVSQTGWGPSGDQTLWGLSIVGLGALGLVSGVGLAARWNRGRCSVWARVAGGAVGLGVGSVISQGSPVVGSFMPGLGASIGCYHTFKPIP